MARKMVIKVGTNDDKSRSKALGIVVGIHGVTSASLGEKDKNQLEVKGSVDPVKVTNALRKKLGKWPYFGCLPTSKAHAELISVSEDKDQKKDDKKDYQPKFIYYPAGTAASTMFPVYYQDVHDPYPCSIL